MNSSRDTNFSPIKYLVFGILFAFFGSHFSRILIFGAALLLGYNPQSNISYEIATDEFSLFVEMYTDVFSLYFVEILGSFPMFYLAGRLFAKYVSGEEKKYSVIFGISFYSNNYRWLKPFWYYVIFLGGIIPTIYYSTQPKINA